MPASQFLPFGTGSSANVMANADYQTIQFRVNGFISGIVPSQQFNTPIRQATFMAAVLGQFMVNVLNTNINDDGNLTGMVSNFQEAIQLVAAAAGNASVAAETAARIAADAAEATIRANNDASEAQTRLNADNVETAARIAADSSEATTRLNADNAEAAARVAADSAEAAARVAADTAEGNARSTGDLARVSLAGGSTGGAMTGPLYNTVSIIVGLPTTNYNPTLSSIPGAGLGGGGVNCYNVNGGIAAGLFGIQTPGPVIGFSYHGNNIGAVTTDGATITVAGTSDYRFKENLVPVTYEYAIQQVKLSKVYMGNYKATPDKRMMMVLAHEHAEVSPESVLGEKDAMKTHVNMVMKGDGTPFADNVTEEHFLEHREDYPEDCTWQAEHTIMDPQLVDMTKSMPLVMVTLNAILDITSKLDIRLTALESKLA